MRAEVEVNQNSQVVVGPWPGCQGGRRSWGMEQAEGLEPAWGQHTGPEGPSEGPMGREYGASPPLCTGGQ